jgi:capsular polysaccharide export protein
VIKTEKPEKLLLFGDGRPHHIEAIAIAKELGVKVWSLEEGYIRPGFIVCEREGNNANSPLKEAILQDNWLIKQQAQAKTNGAKFTKAIFAMQRYFQNSLMRPEEIKQSIIHRPRKVTTEIIKWIKNGSLILRYKVNDERLMLDLREKHPNNYTVVALQVHDDMQIKVYGAGWDTKRLIEESLATFKAANLNNHRLVFKVHPLDRGHLPYQKWIIEAAAALNISDNVDVLHTGNLGPLMKYAYGMMTINSTGGLVALSHNKPLLVLGDAFYDRSSITFKGKMSDFWSKALPPDKDTWRALRSQIYGRSLVSGCYYSTKLRHSTINNVAQRVINDHNPM